ncbi:MAG: hypothetical protein KAJ63_05900 [Methyloprofundus sp.]|nr:hypothetical protein [Methyloprofundus sp.]
MHRLVQLIVLFNVLGLTACQLSEPKPLPVGLQLGDQYYTQVTIRYEKGKFRTTNYRRGIFLGVNSEVELLEVTPQSIKVKLMKENQELLIVNVPKHTGDDVYQAFDKLLAKTKINLSQFDSLERKNINKGTVEKGMSKLAVQVAIGYPPGIRTPSLDSDEWVYWSSRFRTFIVHFDNGKVIQIQK